MEILEIGTVRQVASALLPTKWGAEFRILGFERDLLNGSRRVEPALGFVLGDLIDGVPLVRIHSQCFTSEVLGSPRCDCNDQLDLAMRAIVEEGRGLLIYEHQEGRGIGLMAKLQAYALQDLGIDTVQANHALGFTADSRDFSLPAAILNELGVRRLRLLSNHPAKAAALRAAGIEVVAELPCEVQPTALSLPYLRAKKEKMGHTLGLGEKSPGARKIEASEFASIEAAIGELRAGRMIVVVDDEDRENEGDLTIAAEKITPEAINFMATHGRGLICLAMTGERLDELGLVPMVRHNTAMGGTGFTVSIDLKGRGVTTGISAHDRAETITAALDPNIDPDEFGKPGHVFPLRARDGGVLVRRGQTEAAVDLASLAGLYPAGVICEIVNDDGTMARVPDLVRFCKKHGLLMISVAELARYRMEAGFEGALAAIDGVFPAHPANSLRETDRSRARDLLPAIGPEY